MNTNKMAKIEDVVHPGVILRGLLECADMSQKELAAAIGKTTPVVNDILSGKRNINVEIAVLLEDVFDEVSAEQWLDYQNAYDLDITRKSQKVQEIQRGIRDWKTIEDLINMSAIKKRANLGTSRIEDIAYLCGLYEVSSVDELRLKIDLTTSASYFRKSSANQVDLRNINTWVLLTRISSGLKKISTTFDINRVNQLVERLNHIFFINENTIEQVEKTFDEFGIKFICEKKLDKVPVDGYSFWTGSNPTIVITQRHKWLDNIAFTVFHELGHVVKHLYRDRSADYLGFDVSITRELHQLKEHDADDFATSSIWGNFDFVKTFNKISQPFSAGRILSKLSSTLGINEGIIVGQYQHYCAEHNHPAAYAVCQKMRQKIK